MAPLDSNALRFVIGGHIGTAQTWSLSVWISGGLTGIAVGQAEVDGVRAQLAPLATTWANSLAGFIWSSDTQYDNNKLYYYPNTGTHATLVSQASATAVAGSVTVYQPSYVSAAVSLKSNTPGRSGRGRNYVPVTAVTLSSSHKFTSTTANVIGPAHRTLLQAINALTFAGPGLTNNKVQVASFTRGLMYTVTHLAIDDNPDTQHRRSDKIGVSQVYSNTV